MIRKAQGSLKDVSTDLWSKFENDVPCFAEASTSGAKKMKPKQKHRKTSHCPQTDVQNKPVYSLLKKSLGSC